MAGFKADPVPESVEELSLETSIFSKIPSALLILNPPQVMTALREKGRAAQWEIIARSDRYRLGSIKTDAGKRPTP